MKEFNLQYLSLIPTLISALFVFYLAFEKDSTITEPQKNGLIVGGIFLLVTFIFGLIKAYKTQPKK
jgi:DMSO/TMAO reductase YedYZ heme-binding membrane subunit